MILFNNSGGNPFLGGPIWSGGSFKADSKTENSPVRALFGEERPRDMLGLLTILVLSLHVLCITWLLRPAEKEEPIVPPQIMQVSMISMSSPKPVAAPKPALKQPVKKAEPKKPLPKPLPKKAPPPIVRKSPDFAPAEPAAEAPVAQPSAPSAAPAKAAESQTEQFTEANFRANYLDNPNPPYPALAKSREWQGKVFLRVKVSAEGLSEKVEVDRSSGHDILDEAAVEAVEKWKFVPAKRGATAVASSVIVPIVFTLTKEN